MRGNIVSISALALLLALIFPRTLLAADPPPADLAGYAKAASGNQMADGLASKFTTTDTSKVVYTKDEADVNSRKNAAATAGSSAGKGQGVHTAIGAAMTATAIPMLASIIPAVRAAGAALLAKGVMEFAQAGADSGVKDKNNDQRDLLAQNADQGGKQAAAPDPAKAINSPELQKLLTEKGVNPEDFANKLASGEIKDPESILRAAGMPDSISPEDLQKGNDMANAEMKSIFDSHPGEPIPSTRIGYDETNVTGAAGGGSDGVHGGAGSGNGKNDTLEKALADAGLNPALAASLNFEPNKTTPDGAGGKTAGGGLTATSTADLLAQIFGTDAPKAAAVLADLAFTRLGIQKANRKQNIFQVAHRNFRSWGKWRQRLSRLALSSEP